MSFANILFVYIYRPNPPFSDILTELLHQGDTPEHIPYTQTKRPRDVGTQPEQASGPTSPNPTRPLKSWPTRRPRGTVSQDNNEQDSKQNAAMSPNVNSGPTTQTQLPFSSDHGSTRYPHMEVDFGWDLNHLLLAQMNFTGASQFPDMQPMRAQAYASPASTDTTSVGDPLSPYSMPSDFSSPSVPFMSPFTAYSPPAALTQDMAAMWSDAPNNFK